MDQIQKALKKLSPTERQQLAALLDRIAAGQLHDLDVKKLVGRANIYRVRKGDLRIIFSKERDDIRILRLERRSTTTYRRR